MLPTLIDNQQVNNYVYDASGNMRKDIQNGIDSIEYDYRSLPLRVRRNSVWTTMRYDAGGNRTYKSTPGGQTLYYIPDATGKTLAVLNSDGSVRMLNVYGLDNIGYMNITYSTYLDCSGGGGSSPTYGGGDSIITDAGGSGCQWVTARINSRYYYLKDHLGTIKMTVNSGGTVTSYDDYYPFGMVMEGRSGNFGQADARYKFTSKERDVESGYDYFGARYYDGRVGRWLSVDPLAEKYSGWSPFSFVYDNPLSFVDRNGLWGDPVNKPTYRGWYVSGGAKQWSPEKSKFGVGVRGGGDRSHQGADIEAKVGTDVMAIQSGKTTVVPSQSFGKTVMLEFKDKNGKTKYAQYSHLSETSVKDGQEVKEGDVVGKTGKSGNASTLTDAEEHLHFGISTTDKPQSGMDTYEDPENYITITTPENPKETSTKAESEPKKEEKKQNDGNN